MPAVWPQVRLATPERVDEVLVPPEAEVVVRIPEGEIFAFGTTDRGTHTIHFPGVAQFSFRPPEPLVSVLTTSSSPDAVIDDLFRTTVQPLALQILGFEALHASAIKTLEGVVAFCGASGSGKSTVAFALGRRGFEPWADDVVVLDTEHEEGVVSLQLPQLPRLREPAREFFLLDDAPAPGRAAPGHSAPLTVLFVLSPNETQAVRQMSPPEALECLLPHGLRFTLGDPDRRRSMMTHYLDLVSKVPTFELRFPQSLDRLPALVDEVEDLIRGKAH